MSSLNKLRESMKSVGFQAKIRTLNSGCIKKAFSQLCSISGCVSNTIIHDHTCWNFNSSGFWSKISDIETFAQSNKIRMELYDIMYYECYEFEFDDDTSSWAKIIFESDEVQIPCEFEFLGFDIVSVPPNEMPGCSPLTCCGIGDEVEINQYCLLESIEYSKQLLEQGKFKNSEPGPFRIYSVNKVQLANKRLADSAVISAVVRSSR